MGPDLGHRSWRIRRSAHATPRCMLGRRSADPGDGRPMWHSIELIFQSPPTTYSCHSAQIAPRHEDDNSGKLSSRRRHEVRDDALSCPDNPEEACIPMANANDYQQYADEHHPLHDGN